MASLDMTSFDAALKQLYSEEKINNLVYKNNALLAMMKKNEKFGGKNKVIDVIYGNPQGRSATFTTAQTNATAGLVVAFTITRNHDYAVATIDNETIDASQGDAQSLLEASSFQIDGAISQLTRSLAISMYRTGSGSIGQAPTTGGPFTGTTLTLQNTEDVVNFERNMEIVFSTADGGGSVKTGSVTVVGVNRDTGVLTTDALTAIDGGTGVANNDFIFVQGDYDQKIKGLLAWLPSSAPSATPFFGVDRTADATRLAGVRYDGSAQPIEEALISAIHRVAREGGTPSHCFLAFSKWNELALALGSKVQYIEEAVKMGEAYLNFRAIMIHGPKGPVKVIADQNCPSTRAFLLQLDTWTLQSLGRAPRIIDSDGLRMLRQQSADGVEVRCVYYAQMSCNAPGWNANVNLGS